MTQYSVDIHSLTQEERLRLIQELWDSLDPLEDIPLTLTQQTEIRMRSQALCEGKLKTLPVEEVLAAIPC